MGVNINMAMTMDGRSQLPDGRWRGLSSAEDRRRMNAIRARHSALIVSRRQLAVDNPPFDSCPNLDIIIIVNSGTVDSHWRVFQSGHRVHLFTGDRGYDKLTMALRPLARKFERHEATEWLAAINEIAPGPVLLEGGATLNHLFWSAGLVDGLFLTITPFIIGKVGLSGVCDGVTPVLRPDFYLREDKKNIPYNRDGSSEARWAEAIYKAKLESCESVEDEVFLFYSFR